jgi:hypothetical protein
VASVRLAGGIGRKGPTVRILSLPRVASWRVDRG